MRKRIYLKKHPDYEVHVITEDEDFENPPCLHLYSEVVSLKAENVRPELDSSILLVESNRVRVIYECGCSRLINGYFEIKEI